MPDTDTSQTNLDTEDFDSAMEKVLAERDGAPADDAAADQNEAPSKPAPAAIEEPGSAQEAGTNDPAAGTHPPAVTESNDIWANVPPEARALYERQRHEMASMRGRLSAADRQLATLRTMSNRDEAQVSSDNPLETDEIKALREEYGEIAEPILKLIGGLQQQVQSLQAPVSQMAEQQEVVGRQSQIDTFITAHPDYQSYVSHPSYLDWLATQPKAVQDAAQRAINIEDGHEAAWLLSQFKASLGTITPQAEAPGQSETTKQPAPQPQTDARRQRQLAAGRDGGTTMAPVAAGVPADDFDAAMTAIIAQRERAKGASHQRFG